MCTCTQWKALQRYKDMCYYTTRRPECVLNSYWDVKTPVWNACTWYDSISVIVWERQNYKDFMRIGGFQDYGREPPNIWSTGDFFLKQLNNFIWNCKCRYTTPCVCQNLDIYSTKKLNSLISELSKIPF